MESDLAKLEAAIAKRDVRVALQIMHRMRGALVMVKMTPLSSQLEAIESRLKRNDKDEQAVQDALTLMVELKDLLVQV